MEDEEKPFNKKRPRPDDDDDDDDEDLFASPPEEPDAKRARIEQIAKQRLSKWAARLFDPDRPRGLVEAPMQIPLNDEFLQAFGKRVKEDDDAVGVKLEIDRTIDDEDKDNNDSDEEDAKPATQRKSTKLIAKEGTKIKITNLKFTTTGATIQKACSKFGPVEECHLVMDKESHGSVPVNIGRAYVTFENALAAKACLEGLMELEGRPLRLSLAAATPSRGGRASVGRKGVLRFWERDITTKCFRCGQVGHMESNCENPPKPKPCPFCARTDHSFRDCPVKQVCFNCGVPGHVSRYCTRPRNLPPREICTLCLQSGHTKFNCYQHRDRNDDPSVKYAVCMVCNRQGHFLCRQLKWFDDLTGVWCSNCGLPGHIAVECDRPRLDTCFRHDYAIGYAEVDAAVEYNTIEAAAAAAAEKERQGKRDAKNEREHERDTHRRHSYGERGGSNNNSKSRGRQLHHPQQQQQYHYQDGNNDNHRRRAKSMPHRSRGGDQHRGYNDNNNQQQYQQRGYNQQYQKGHRRQSNGGNNRGGGRN